MGRGLSSSLFSPQSNCASPSSHMRGRAQEGEDGSALYGGGSDPEAGPPILQGTSGAPEGLHRGPSRQTPVCPCQPRGPQAVLIESSWRGSSPRLVLLHMTMETGSLRILGCPRSSTLGDSSSTSKWAVTRWLSPHPREAGNRERAACCTKTLSRVVISQHLNMQKGS